MKGIKRKSKRQISKEYKNKKTECNLINIEEKELPNLLKKHQTVVLLIYSSAKHTININPKTKFKKLNKFLKKTVESTNKVVEIVPVYITLENEMREQLMLKYPDVFFIKMDIENNKQFSFNFQITKIPQIFFYKNNERVTFADTDRIEGYTNKTISAIDLILKTICGKK